MLLTAVVLKNYDSSLCATDEFVTKSLLEKLIIFEFAMIKMRVTYYTGWKFTHGSMALCGQTYNKYEVEGKTVEKCDRADNANLTRIELSINPRVRIQYWNRGIHLWLKYYVFFKIPKSLRVGGIPSFVTFGLSAIWHGFYPVYYLFFFEYYMIEQVSAYMENKYDIFNKIEKWDTVYKWTYNILVSFILHYFGLTFSILTMYENYNFYRAFYWVPFGILFGSYFYILLIAKPPKKERKELADSAKEEKKDK